MNLEMLQDCALLLLYPLALLGGIYAFCLWRLVTDLKEKLNDLYNNCCRVRQHWERHFLSDHQVEHQSLWEALHHHEHGPKPRAKPTIKIVGKG